MHIKTKVAVMALTLGALSIGPSRADDQSRITHEAMVNGSLDEVWAAFTTEKELEAWMVAHAEFDLRIGGKMRTLYNPAGKLGDPATIENTIISYDPKRMLSIKVSRAPEGFPFPQAVKSMWTVIYFDAVSTTKTHVKIVGLGFGVDEESKRMRAFFDRGNAHTLRQLQSYFASQTSGEK